MSVMNEVALVAIVWSLCDFAWAFTPFATPRPWWRMLVSVPFLAALAFVVQAHAEPATLTTARTAQVTCVQREYRTRTASAGVSATEAALVARAQAEHACALEAWSRALGAAAEVRVVTATRAPVVCEPGPVEWSFVDRVLVPAGSCAIGCGLVAGGAAAAAVWGCSR